jgi:hypothetical protein
MSKRNPKWVSLMNQLNWEGISIWGEVIDRKFTSSLIQCREWVIANRKYINPESLQAFDLFFIAEEKLKSYDYALKERAVEAFGALYRKEKTSGE